MGSPIFDATFKTGRFEEGKTMTGMTDEERKKLCATLRRMPGMLRHDCSRAADELERIAKKLAEAEAALRNTLLNYKISDINFLDLI